MTNLNIFLDAWDDYSSGRETVIDIQGFAQEMELLYPNEPLGIGAKIWIQNNE
jgi:hypothetical protein